MSTGKLNKKIWPLKYIDEKQSVVLNDAESFYEIAVVSIDKRIIVSPYGKSISDYIDDEIVVA